MKRIEQQRMSRSPGRLLTRRRSVDEPNGPVHSRTLLLETQSIVAEDLRGRAGQGRTAEEFSPDFQVCLPYRGLFVWHVEGDEIVADANQVLFITGGEPYYVRQPLPSAYAELVITPKVEILAELVGLPEGRLSAHPLFRRRSRSVSPRLQRQRAHLLARRSLGDTLSLEEGVVDVIRASLHDDSVAPRLATSTRRLLARTKEFLHAHLGNALELATIARAVGASPAYLTDTFRRTEGVPLHQYLVQLRLARAVAELPHAEDLTTLALDLGFSSHSHFSAVFKRAFACTPSAFRGTTRGRPIA